jgi:NitT/TauT family transport system substrate-binding protein
MRRPVASELKREVLMRIIQGRRHFLTGLSAAGVAGILGFGRARADEGPPETTTIRLARNRAICLAPVYISEDLLRAEGFTEIRHVFSPPASVGRGEIDFDFQFGASIASHLDAGERVTALAGLHSGCHEVFAHEPIRTIGDLKGKRVGVQSLGSGRHLNLALMAADAGLDPQKDIHWVTSAGNPMALFVAKEVDAFLGSPPEPQELRARKIGHMIVNIATDKPWSQYFCCMVFGKREFVRDHPIATKRFLRAILKATDVCAAEPERTARLLVDGRFTSQYDYALQTLTELPYARWREFDPEDSLRFYALRLHEVGMIKSSPSALLADGADWRFLDGIKRELKA